VVEGLLLVVPPLFTAVTLLLSLAGVTKIDWRWLALVSLAVFVTIVIRDIAQLVGQIRMLEQTQANLQLVWRPEHPYLWPAWGYRIGIRNEGPAMAENVEVVLRAISPEPWIALNMLPSRLGHKGGYCNGDHCDINKNSEHHYDVLRDITPRGMTEKMVWGLQTVELLDTEVIFKAGVDYLFKIGITAKNYDNDVPNYLMIQQRAEGGLGISVVEGPPLAQNMVGSQTG
jgi:hypothetical protein